MTVPMVASDGMTPPLKADGMGAAAAVGADIVPVEVSEC